MEPDNFIAGYIECALWLAYDPDGEPRDDLTPDDIPNDVRRTMRDECLAFITANRDDIDRYCEILGKGYFLAGHDFFLTRNGHGTGYWDRSYEDDYVPVGKRLSDASRAYGEWSLMIGDDDTIFGG